MKDFLGTLPPNVSTYGGAIDSLYTVILVITVAIFFIVQLLLVWFLWRYRAGASPRATYTHGNTTLEILWTIAPTVIVVFLGFWSRGLWAHIKIELPPADVTVRVSGKQFNWEILYSGPDGKFGTEDDYQVDNDLRVPVNKTVHVVLGSHDVIHSFFVPQARLKQDAIPGREIKAWFKITEPGVYEIPCAELCGFGHSGMKGQLMVLAEADYASWLKEQWPPAGEPGQAEAPEGPPAEVPQTPVEGEGAAEAAAPGAASASHDGAGPVPVASGAAGA
jgi:cytochrome c oxidase subunit 2